MLLGFSFFNFFTITFLLLHTQTYKLLNLTATTQSDSKILCTASMNCCYSISLYIFFFTMSNSHGFSTPPSFCIMPSKLQLPVLNSLLLFPKQLLGIFSTRVSKPHLPKNQVVPFPPIMFFSFQEFLQDLPEVHMNHQYTGFSLRILYIFKLVIKRLFLLFFWDNREGDGIPNCCCHHNEQMNEQKESRQLFWKLFLTYIWKDTRLVQLWKHLYWQLQNCHESSVIYFGQKVNFLPCFHSSVQFFFT